MLATGCVLFRGQLPQHACGITCTPALVARQEARADVYRMSNEILLELYAEVRKSLPALYTVVLMAQTACDLAAILAANTKYLATDGGIGGDARHGEC